MTELQLRLGVLQASASQHHNVYQNLQYLQQFQCDTRSKMSVPNGDKPIVICAHVIEECADLEKAQSKAEELAHKHSATAYVLKPVKKVAPKRDVVTTELP